MGPLPRVIALLAAYNEADIIDQVLSNLIAEGVQVHFLDDGSTDATRRLAEARVGRGVVAVEALREPGEAGDFSWTSILARKETLAQELDADWFIHHDADEFRESPWPGVGLVDGIARVDRGGYTAIDFALFDFWPTHDGFTPDQDVRQAFQHFEPAHWWNRRQIKCWKKQGERVDLVSTGGHEAMFAGRRVYPLRFLLRHYPIRGSVHGRRKVFQERLPRFAADERQLGWHCQYDEYIDGETFVRVPSALTLFDHEKVRMEVATKDLQRIDAAREEVERRMRAVEEKLDSLTEDLQRIDAARQEAERCTSRVEDERVRLAGEVANLSDSLGRLLRELENIYESKTWRWSRPIRAVLARLFRT